MIVTVLRANDIERDNLVIGVIQGLINFFSAPRGCLLRLT